MSLRFVRGGRAPIVMGSFTVHVTADDEPLPFIIDAVIVEEDRWRSLAAPKELEGAVALVGDAAPLRTLTRAHDVEALPLGTVEVRTGPPALLRAIVIDLDADPCCVPGSVAAATIACVRTCRERRLDHVRLPLLGSDKGRLDPVASARTIFHALLGMSAERGRLTIVLVVPGSVRGDVQGIGEQAAASATHET